MDDKSLKSIKTVAGVAITIGVAAIVGNAVRFTTPEVGIGALKKFCVGLGSMAIGGLLSDASVSYANKKIDETAEFVGGMYQNIKPDETEEVYEV